MKSALISMFVLCLSLPAVAQTPQPTATAKKDVTPVQTKSKGRKSKKVPRCETLLNGKPATPGKAPFKTGERIELEVTWFGIKGGVATIEVAGFEEFEGASALHLRVTAITSKAFSVFIKVEDVGESWIHPTGLYSMGYVTNQSEGSRQEFQKVVMDNEKGTASFHRVIRKKGHRVKRKDQQLKLSTTHVQDALSMLYYYRAFPLEKKGDTLVTDVHTSRKMWTFKVEVLGKEKVKTPAGTFDTIKLLPSVSIKGKVQDRGTMTIWITDDERRIPVKIQSEVKIGKINAVLIRYEEGDDF